MHPAQTMQCADVRFLTARHEDEGRLLNLQAQVLARLRRADVLRHLDVVVIDAVGARGRHVLVDADCRHAGVARIVRAVHPEHLRARLRRQDARAKRVPAQHVDDVPGELLRQRSVGRPDQRAQIRIAVQAPCLEHRVDRRLRRAAEHLQHAHGIVAGLQPMADPDVQQRNLPALLLRPYQEEGEEPDLTIFHARACRTQPSARAAAPDRAAARPPSRRPRPRHRARPRFRSPRRRQHPHRPCSRAG